MVLKVTAGKECPLEPYIIMQSFKVVGQIVLKTKVVLYLDKEKAKCLKILDMNNYETPSVLNLLGSLNKHEPTT